MSVEYEPSSDLRRKVSSFVWSEILSRLNRGDSDFRDSVLSLAMESYPLYSRSKVEGVYDACWERIVDAYVD